MVRMDFNQSPSAIIEIPSHIDIYIVRGEVEFSEVNVVDFIVASAKAKVACLEA